MDRSSIRTRPRPFVGRREFMNFVAAAIPLGTQIVSLLGTRPVWAAVSDQGGENMAKQAPTFATRGIVIAPDDVKTWPWPSKAKDAGLTTIALHSAPSKTADFVKSDKGQLFLDECRRLGIDVEYEQHAMGELLPRELFAKDPSMFRMDDKGKRVPDANLCVHSKNAMSVVCENAVGLAETLRPTTGRYYYWIDDGLPMCRCPECIGLSDSEQALLLEIELLKTLRTKDPRASLAHLCYHNTLHAPVQVKPIPGLFLEFAPIARKFDQPLSQRDIKSHTEFLDTLDANLAVFGKDTAQALEYWLDVSRFSGWKRETLTKIPWHNDVFVDDLLTYSKRGIRHVTTFACWLDGAYIERFGEPPLIEYGKGFDSVRG